MLKNYKKGLSAVGIAKGNRGFTLIELLVVIAIIGVLASVVLAATNSARTKGADAAVKANFSNARAQAEIFYDSNQSYANVCVSGVAGSIYDVFVAGAIAGGATNFDINGGSYANATSAKCNHGATGWAIEGPMKGGDYWCVDYTGKSKKNLLSTRGLASSTDYTC